jgi:hypothetical protein
MAFVDEYIQSSGGGGILLIFNSIPFRKHVARVKGVREFKLHAQPLTQLYSMKVHLPFISPEFVKQRKIFLCRILFILIFLSMRDSIAQTRDVDREQVWDCP